MMKKDQPVAANPDAYVAALGGWQRPVVEALRKAVLDAAPVREQIKWTHLVYFSNGPVALIRAEEARVLFGFWRGQRLRDIEPRLKPGGKYEMATIILGEDDSIDPGIATDLLRAAVRLNEELGDPTAIGLA
jgi:hypothetical protein